MPIALVYSGKYLEHKPSMGHPERPERLKAIVEALKRAKLWGTPSVKVIGLLPLRLETRVDGWKCFQEKRWTKRNS